MNQNDPSVTQKIYAWMPRLGSKWDQSFRALMTASRLLDSPAMEMALKECKRVEHQIGRISNLLRMRLVNKARASEERRAS